LFVILLQDMS